MIGIPTKLMSEFNYLERVWDDKKKEWFLATNYSYVIQALPTDVETLKIMYPHFKFVPLFLQYTHVGFNKSVDWAEWMWKQRTGSPFNKKDHGPT